MARKGRKGKAKRREPNGQIQRTPRSERAEAVVAVVRRQPHRVNLDNPSDVRAADVLGLLNKNKLITDLQYEAGVNWQKARAAMLRAKGLPNPNPKSGGFDYVAEGTDEGSAPEASDHRTEEEKIADALTKYERLFQAISKPHLLYAKTQVWRVCDENLWPLSKEHLADLRKGLNAMARHRRGCVEAPPLVPVDNHGAPIPAHAEVV